MHPHGKHMSLSRRNEIKSEFRKRDNSTRTMVKRERRRKKKRKKIRVFAGDHSSLATPRRLGTIRPASFCTAFRRNPRRSARPGGGSLPVGPTQSCEGNGRKPSPQCPTPWNQDVRAHGCTNRSSFTGYSLTMNVPRECTGCLSNHSPSSSLGIPWSI